MQEPATGISKISIVEVTGSPFAGNRLREVAFLNFEEKKFVNGENKFLTSKDGIKRGILHGIQQWLQGIPFPKRHHGWNQEQHGGVYTKCYVFKHGAEQVRLYGYLIHPEGNPRAMLCLLMHFARKNENETDTEILDDVNEIGRMDEVFKMASQFWKKKLDEREAQNEKSENGKKSEKEKQKEKNKKHKH